MTTVLYILSGWLLFNVAFAIAMYFRPTRKPSVNPVDHHERSKPGGDLVNEAAIVRSAPDPKKKTEQPAMLSRVLFFGFWLNDHRHSA